MFSQEFHDELLLPCSLLLLAEVGQKARWEVPHFNTPHDGILFLLGGMEIGFHGIFDVCGNEQ